MIRVDPVPEPSGYREEAYRQVFFEMYQKGEINLEGLKRVAPLIARAVEKTKRH